MTRPVAVTIFAVIAVIYGIFNLLLVFLGLIGIALNASGVAAVAPRYDFWTLVYAVIWDAILGILYLAFGIGTFRMKGWAWTTGVVVLVLDVVRAIVGYFILGFSATSIVTRVIALLLLWYLFRPNVRAAFGRAA